MNLLPVHYSVLNSCTVRWKILKKNSSLRFKSAVLELTHGTAENYWDLVQGIRVPGRATISIRFELNFDDFMLDVGNLAKNYWLFINMRHGSVWNCCLVDLHLFNCSEEIFMIRFTIFCCSCFVITRLSFCST
jgi:hypothetical protein